VSDVGAFGALGPQAPSFRVRTKIPARELERLGVRMHHYPLLSQAQDDLLHCGSMARRVQAALQARRALRRLVEGIDGRVDVALVQRQVDLLPSLSLERLVARDRRLVLDVDDAVWLDASPSARGHRLALLKGTARKVRWLAERAETVIAGNELLADWLARHSRNVVIVPSLVEHRDVPVRRHATGDRIVLGWIGSPSTAPSLKRLREPLQAVASRHPELNVNLLVVGGEAPTVEGQTVHAEPWSEDRERDFLQTVDVGLMPLPDNQWTRGKCAYKALQYMAAGIPVVADDVGVSAAVIGHGQGGLIAHSAKEWVEHLHSLATDPALRTRLGGNGRRRVERDFSVEAWAPRLAAALSGHDAQTRADLLSYAETSTTRRSR
jgi:glycosyltransferase involved in cell wall biosynthesis